MQPDRLPPHDEKAEQAALGCVLLDPRESIPAIAALPEGLFYDLRHQIIFDACRHVQDNGGPLDMVTLHSYLSKTSRLEEVGGINYLSALEDATPSAANLEWYLQTLLDHQTRRRLIAASTKAIVAAYESEQDAAAALDSAQQEFSEISNGLVGECKKDIWTLVDRAVESLERQYDRGNQMDGLATGFLDLDRMTNGLKPGNMVVLAGRPATGKTSLAMNIAEHVAVEQGLPVGVFSLEMTADELVERMLCTRAKLNKAKIRAQEVSQEDFARIATSKSQIIRAPIHIDDTEGLRIGQLRARARRMQLRFGIQLLVIDYLQLVDGDNSRENSREREVAKISKGIKSLAKSLSIPVIVLCQLNRELDKDKNRKPRLSDLRESGAIEQDADLVGMLYEPKEEPDPLVTIREINLLVAKHRNGGVGDVRLTFFKEFTRFENRAL